MKIIHTGDIHIGSALKGFSPEKAAIRKAEILDGFCKLTRYAKENGVAAVLIAGDLFDENGVLPYMKRTVLTAIETASPVRFFYVSGNHDATVEFGDHALPQNLYFFSENHGFFSYDLGEKITLTGADTRNFPTAFSTPPVLPRDTFNILLLHGAEDIPFPLLRDRNVDYLALGHIHKPSPIAEALDGRGRYRYCGCLEGRGFDEVGARGFFLLEIQNGSLIGEKFLSLAKRTVVEVRVDISACDTALDVENAALAALQTTGGENIVKIVLCGRHKEGLRKDISLLCARLCERFFFAKVEDESRVAIDYDALKTDKTERGEFVREVGRYEMNEDFRAEVLEVGLKALLGEEIDL